MSLSIEKLNSVPMFRTCPKLNNANKVSQEASQKLSLSKSEKTVSLKSTAKAIKAAKGASQISKEDKALTKAFAAASAFIVRLKGGVVDAMSACFQTVADIANGIRKIDVNKVLKTKEGIKFSLDGKYGKTYDMSIVMKNGKPNIVAADHSKGEVIGLKFKKTSCFKYLPNCNFKK